MSYKSYLRVLLPQTAEIRTIPKSLPRSFQNNFKCLFFKRLYQIDEILKYKFVNIILDEVELYFHPEMQRQFVFLLLHAIRCVKFRHLKGIHILFATHSPFILSDIPSDHVLALGLRNEKDKEEPIKTFGANIMEMLSNTFFMDSSIGETVRREISKLVEYHIDIVRNGNIHNDDFLGERNRFKYVCDNIGDDFFKKICSRMLNEIEAKIKKLQ